MNLGLGTAQFGMKYGVTNSVGKVFSEEVPRILALASELGVQVLDTAPSYGDSEVVLGRELPESHSFKIVTKTPHIKEPLPDDAVVQLVVTTLNQSLARLHQSSVYGLLVHRPTNLLEPLGDALYSALKELKTSGKVEKIGVSVYNADQIDEIFEKYPLDLVQVPLNVLDQRLLRSGHLKKLKERGVEIHVRSVFLQGVLLKAPDELPAYFNPMKNHLKRYHDAVRSCGLSPVQAAISFVAGLQEIHTTLCGVTNVSELAENLSGIGVKSQGLCFSDFAMDDVAMLDPMQWRVV